MERFLMLLHENPSDFATVSPADMQRIIEGYKAWTERLHREGKLEQGEKLKDEGGRRLSRKGGQPVVTDGPYTEAKDVVGGLFILKARTYEEAVQLAMSCPHLDHGEIELRAIDPT